MLGADDSLDVFGVHGVGGIVGALLTGVFNTQALGGPGLVTDWVTATVGSNGIGAQVWIQPRRCCVTVVWSGVVAFVAFKIVDLVIGLRVPKRKSAKAWTSARTARRPTASKLLEAFWREIGAACGQPLFRVRRPRGLALARHGPTCLESRLRTSASGSPWSRTSSPRSPARSTSWSSASWSRCRPSSAGSGSNGWSTRRRSTPRWTCAMPASSWRRWTPTCSPAASTTSRPRCCRWRCRRRWRRSRRSAPRPRTCC